MKKNYHILFLIIFFLSGFSGLIYESIWTQYLKLFLGHAAYAQTLVLIIFMGGMAIGSYLASRYSGKWINLFRAYAIAEGIIGIFALIFHESFTSFLDLSYNSVLQNIESPFAISLYKWVSSSAIILPQSILLGTTFPLMSAAILRSYPTSPGKNISLLYFTNSLGAAIGVLISGFLFINAFGLPGTIKIAGVLNLFIALLVLFLIKKSQVRFTKPKDSLKINIEQNRKFLSTTTILLGVSAFTGMASFIYEIGWIRMLNLVLGTSTHAFELMLSAFIFGLAFGGLWIRKRIDKMSNPFLSLGYIQIIMGVFALSTLLLYNKTFDVMQWIMANVEKNDTGYFLFNLTSNGIALIIMLPATFCAGMTLPIITTLLLRTQGEQSIGSVYAWNTIGGIIGVIIAVQIGMPLLGLKGLIGLGAGIDILIGVIILFFISSKEIKIIKKIIMTSSGIIALLYIVFFFSFDPHKMASGVYGGFPILAKDKNQILFYKDGKTSTISVIKNNSFGGVLSLRTNGKTDASIFYEENNSLLIDESTTFQLAIIPMALNPNAEKVANIGLGSGMTTKMFLDNPKIKNVHTIEIEKEVLNAIKHLGPKVESVFSDHRSEIIIDDAKSFFASSNNKYDIIVSEPSNPWISGISGLFSFEYYKLINNHLNDDGIFAQWLHLYNLDINLTVSVLKAFSESFNDYEVYILNSSECLIVGKKVGDVQPLDQFIFEIPAIAKSLKHVNVNNIQDIEFRFLGNKKNITPYLNSFTINTNSDYYPVLDQNATRTRFLSLDATDIYNFTHHYHPVVSLLCNKKTNYDSTDITLNMFFPNTKEANDAKELFDFFVNSNDFNYSLLSEEIKLEAQLTKELFILKKEHQAKNNRLPMLLNTSIRMTPYLTPKEMNQVWNSLCVIQDSTLTNEEKAWVNLFKAVGQRNIESIISASDSIFSTYSDGLPIQPKEYLVSAAMIAHIAKGSYDKAQIIWWRYNNTSDNPKSKMLFEFLLANCKKIKNGAK